MSEELIRVRDATKVFTQGEVEVHALRGVDLTVGAGEFSALAGPSGCGKTTLLNLIGVLDNPTSGSVTVRGEDVSHMRRGEAADFRLRHVGFVFQAYNLVPVLTAYENAEFTLLLQGESHARRRAVVEPLLERVGLGGGLLERRPHELSGGQQQRVAVVRALATSPAIILADEPTANLDSKASTELLDLMVELNGELGTTFLLASHDPLVLERVRRVVHLLDGKVSEDVWD